MTTPASHRRNATRPAHFPPVPAGAIPAQRRPEAGVHRAGGGGSGRRRMAVGVALVLAAALGAGWLLVSPSAVVDDPAATAARSLSPLDGESPRLTGRIPVGTFDLAHEIEAGVYRTGGSALSAGPAGCRWRLAGGVSPRVDGGTTSGPVTLTLPAGGDFTSIGCQDWVRVG